ncbi:LysR substrate-binding domain-containing protein [Pseudomonas japonica]|uniref:LysR substrate-binding domain-containing protein n=1 Tax=Pseudomonas japonica TaxID=256466 RepID=UPI00381856FF
MDPSLLPAMAMFALVARHKSFTKAALELRVSRAALSQSLKSLEQRLNVRLLNRTTRDMSLTEEGQRLLSTLAPALASIDQTVRNINDTLEEPSGLLRVNTPRVAAKHLIEPWVGEFLARYPRLRLELVMDDGFANIVADGCDAGVRLGESLAEHMVAVPISPMIEMIVAGAPEYLRHHPAPTTPADLVQHNCLGYRNATSGSIYQWEFSSPDSEGHSFVFEPQGSLITNDDDGMIRAALQGVGLLQHMDLALREPLLAGSLQRVLQRWSKPFPGFYLYVPTRDQMPAKVRALLNFLVEKRELQAARKL